ncbi:asparagine synthase (glutamine-hydrolyzing) [Methylocystis sp. MJC1]|uniref:asparagine synthase (glutamine-hydrolyzing) n=1 Tax=Methylocystis sp. MJC1 TaxID=2654282 RepID=UPI0013EE1FB7|nr:asparagine synthase (glutamine-hydrolyzing) [Methylocystis sp. MJC1]KAF2991190.1 Asparagine synthetase [glutamine-hydrolyzing] 1 [Methylocystis sp. MJC1]MBU6526266.1 asparagine synthase (glutamine-hydrolyzing) [Methylocystis sp. MJC1]UZX12721.1 asparagine synthase (glutamine-hydrolyzing) [Methylocystis sp. MJC1]
MCGFLAIFHTGGHHDLRAALLDGVSVIRHRGPNERGIWVDPSGKVGLAHARLSIIGLGNGRQPISSQDGSVHLVVNGEFYDYEQIRDELVARGCVFRTDSDSEIALHLYCEFGAAGLERLRGEFALVIYDANERHMIVMRDRFGIKPVFVTEHDGTIYIGSEIKALIAAGVPAIWDEDAYISRGFYLENKTLFRKIRSVTPGHFLTVSSSGLREHSYWDLDFPTAESLERGTFEEENIVPELREKILEAVKLRMRSDVPIAVYLSGGVDSAAMLGCATHLNGAPLDAFNLSFTDSESYDERGFAEQAATHAGARFHAIPVNQDDLADNFSEALWHNETPFFNAHGVAKFILSRAVRDAGVKVVITGEGSDEIFAGYPHFRRDMLLYNAQRQDKELVTKLRANLNSADATYADEVLPPDAAWMAAQLGHGVSWVNNQASWLAPLRELYDEETRWRWEKMGPYRRFYSGVAQSRINGRDPVHKSMYLWAKTFLPNFVLTTLGDRMEMAHSVEGRVPLLDHHLAEYACRIPVWLKIKGGVEKHVFREAMRPFIPDALYRRKKHYFRAPPAMLGEKNRLSQLVEDTIHGDALQDIPFFDTTLVRRAWSDAAKESPARRALLDPVFMEIASLCSIQRSFRMSSNPSRTAPDRIMEVTA